MFDLRFRTGGFREYGLLTLFGVRKGGALRILGVVDLPRAGFLTALLVGFRLGLRVVSVACLGVLRFARV